MIVWIRFFNQSARIVQPNDCEDGGYRVHHILAALVNRKVISIKAGICETKLKWRIQPKLLVDRLAEKNSKNKRKLGYVVVFNVYSNRSLGRRGRFCVDLVKQFTSRLCLKPVVKANAVVTVLVVFENILDRFRIHLHVVFKMKKKMFFNFFFLLKFYCFLRKRSCG